MLLWQVFQEAALRKAKASVDAAGNFVRRERNFIQRQKVEEMLAWSMTHPYARRHALLFLFSYSFLLRTPSEALPVRVGKDGGEIDSNAVLFKDGDQLVLILRRRKNKPQGSRLVRKCTCHRSKTSCVYHEIGALVDAAADGDSLFGGISPNG